MKNLKTIVAILVFASLLGLLAVPYSSSNSFYHTSFPEDGNSLYGGKNIAVNFDKENESSVEYIIALEGEDSNAYIGETIAQKAIQSVEENLRNMDIEDGVYNIYTSKDGDNYSLVIEGENIQTAKSAVPTELVFENGFIGWIKNKGLTLGLDLQGGVQLDYLVDLSKVEPERIESVIQGNLATVERRVNKLGVSEPNIYLSEVGDETHIVVELAGVKDVNEAKAQIGKTVQLEFKEPRPDGQETSSEEIMAKAKEAQTALKADPENFRNIALQYQGDGSDDGVKYSRSAEVFVDEIVQSKVSEALDGMKVGNVSDTISDIIGTTYDMSLGKIITEEGVYVVKLLDEKMDTKEVSESGDDFFTAAKNNIGEEVKVETIAKRDLDKDIVDTLDSVGLQKATDIITKDGVYTMYYLDETVAPKADVSHILIAYDGAERATATRSKEEAKAEIDTILADIKAGGDFAAIAKEKSDCGSAAKGGKLDEFGAGQMATAFEEASFGLKNDEMSEVVETEFGYHIIKRHGGVDEAYKIAKISLPENDENKAKLEKIIEDMGERKVEKEVKKVKYDSLLFPFDSSPWVSTGLDGEHFTNASLQYNIDVHPNPYVQIHFDDEGKQMFADITERLKGKQLAIFVGGELISAPTVNDSITGGIAQITGGFDMQEASNLANDLNSGAIPAPLELSSEYKVSPTLGADALSSSIYAGFVGLCIVALYMVLYYKIPGLIAGIALIFYALILIAILKYSGIFGMDVVLTLAGVAGVILSIGMAVDANVLIFERLKEEMRSGKSFATALEIGFDRAWTSIRDANVSSLITCAILYWFGSSIIRGFAVMLGIGILISMFTAIVLTRGILGLFAGSKIARDHRWLFGDKK